ncbi:MAG: RNA helicase [Candidatus Kapaibacterium sp.]|nr:MAG: RNA helicase [Candidatus Kapabacteria bacterium]
MARLEELSVGAIVRGILANQDVIVTYINWYGPDVIELGYKDSDGRSNSRLLYRSDEPYLEIVEEGRRWAFDGDGGLYRLISEAQRIRLAYLFDPLLAVHSSLLDPLPHQITAVYETMLGRQPLRFLLADDPGAGKTIMAGLLIKELKMRGDVGRCLIVCPGNLVEQWQEELYQRFQLPFEIATTDKLEAARTGNWFLENDLAIVRLDKAARDESVQAKLATPECQWDLVIVDEAHKMSASFFGGEIKYTKRYKLGQLLSRHSRHFLLLTATPHNGKEEDFQLFLALLDGDRFPGRFRTGVHQVDTSDLMRRMLKENLVKFDGRPLFPERIAHTVPYKLSDLEARLYKDVTEYVREEFNRADTLADEKRKGTVGFALTTLQRRLASSPEAIYQSLRRRRERLESQLRELELLQRGRATVEVTIKTLDPEDLEGLDEAPETDQDALEEQVLDRATAARTIQELRAEIQTLQTLEALAKKVRESGEDRKWRELAHLLEMIAPQKSPAHKLVIFTEHRDTLTYLVERIRSHLGRPELVVAIHGAMNREERKKAQEAFLYDPQTCVLVATDAAGEGINLQRAHLMINYDLPWNPNRLEQRFGRIHRIGQTEVCHLWNLVALETREGDVYHRLLRKLDEARAALGGKVFDVLGKLQFEGKSLRDLLIEAIRYGEQPEVRMKLDRIIEGALRSELLRDLVEDRALSPEILNAERLQRLREDMERAAARRLQPHYIESFFLEAFCHLGGSIHEREPRRYEVTHVPAAIRQRDRLIGTREPVLRRYERITFEKELVTLPGKPLAAFVCPGHPLLDAVIDLILERHRDLLKRGTILVDETDPGTLPRVIFTLEHSIQDGTLTPNGDQRSISRRMLYVELDAEGRPRNAAYAPYLDFRPLREGEPSPEEILAQPECAWITQDLEAHALAYAVTQVVPEHLAEVRRRRLELIEKTRIAVKDRLTKEIAYWDHRAQELRLQEQAGKPNARLNWQEAQRRAEELTNRLEKRMQELDLEAQISPLPPVVMGGFVVIPAGLLAKMKGHLPPPDTPSAETQAIAARARAIVMEAERRLGFQPVDRESDHLGYDIESRDPASGHLRFIEVKGRVAGADTITVTRNEILTSLNKPDAYILAIVLFESDEKHRLYYVRSPFQREPDFGVTSVNYELSSLLSQAEEIL